MSNTVLAWPTLERLAYAHDKRRVDALRYWRDLTQPMALSGIVFDDDGTEDFGVEVRPTEPALLKAIGWKVTGKTRWRHNGKKVHTYASSDMKPEIVPEAPPVAAHIRFGDLRFRGNTLAEWGRTKGDKPLKPIERPAQGKGAAARSPARVWAYLKLDGAVPLPGDAHGLERVACSADGAGRVATVDKTPSSAEAEQMLAEARANTRVMPTVTRCPDGLMRGKQWIGGLPSCRNDAPSASVAWDSKTNPAHELARAAEESRLRQNMGPAAAILDEACTRATAKTIGAANGHTESSAAKYGAALIDKAIDKLISVAELQHVPVAANDDRKMGHKAAA